MTDQPFSEPTPIPAPVEEAPSLARSASIIAFGNIVSRLLGLGRETTIAYFFGASGLVSAFQAASTIPTMIFDLLVGGMLSAALVPVFSDYARPERRREFGQVVGTVLSVIGLVVAGLAVGIMLLAEPLAHLVAGGLPPELLDVTASLLRIMTPAIWFLAVSGVVTGALFALKRFTFPAFAAAVYNLGIIVAALLLNERLGIFSLAVGVLLGSVLQFLLQAPDLLRARVVPRIGLRHPALRRIWLLYLPILFGLLVSQVQVIIDRRLASGTGEQSLAWMRDATTLFQLPHGLVAVAISLAALPSLAQYFAAGNERDFRATLGRGLRTVLLLITPATVGLLVLGTPIVQLVFQRGAFQPSDTEAVVAALNLYLIGLIPASLDWLLNYTFYARNDTLTPAIVGVISVGIYLVFALLLVKPFGYLGLVFADSMKHTGHFLLMWFLLRRRLGDLRDLQGGVTALRSLAAAGVMSVVLLLALAVLQPRLPAGFAGNLALVAIAGGLGGAVYLAMVSRLGVQEAGLAVQRFSRRLRRGRN
jgi:putative peptidoglycan lipid II flippase